MTDMTPDRACLRRANFHTPGIRPTLADYSEMTDAYLAAAEAKLARVVEALSFYADFHENPNDGPWGVGSQDYGKTARVALSDIAPAPDNKGETE